MNESEHQIIEGADIQEFSRCFVSVTNELPREVAKRLKEIRGQLGVIEAFKEMNAKTVKMILEEFSEFKANVIAETGKGEVNFKVFGPAAHWWRAQAAMDSRAFEVLFHEPAGL